MCSSWAAWFSLSALSQWISTLDYENGPTDYFPPLAAIAEDELVQPLSLLGICTVVPCAWQDPVQRCWADRRGVWCSWPCLDPLKNFIVEWSNPECTEGQLTRLWASAGNFCSLYWSNICFSWNLFWISLGSTLGKMSETTANCCVALTVRSLPHNEGKEWGERAYCCSYLAKQP